MPAVAFNLALDRLRNQVVNTSDIVKEEAAGIAYALYVLARNGRLVMGDLRYLADNKLGEFRHAARPAPRSARRSSALGDRGRGRVPPSPARCGLRERRRRQL